MAKKGKAKDSQKANFEINAQKIGAETFAVPKRRPRWRPRQQSHSRLPSAIPQPFTTKPSASGNQNGSSTTTGLNGTLQKFDDGRAPSSKQPRNLTAKRTGSLNASLTASCRRVQQGNTTIIHQVNYSYKQRVFGFDDGDRGDKSFASRSQWFPVDHCQTGQGNAIWEKRSSG